MKRLIFLMIAFACGLTASIASDVGTRHTDYLQNPFVITQITPMPVMFAVQPTITPVIIVAALPATQTALAYYSIVETDGWRAPMWIPSLVINDNANSNQLNDSYNILKRPILTLNSYRINRTPDNYNINYSYGLRN